MYGCKGIGKSELVKMFSYEMLLRNYYRDGVIYCDLKAIIDQATVE
jgi:predicted ATPase